MKLGLTPVSILICIFKYTVNYLFFLFENQNSECKNRISSELKHSLSKLVRVALLVLLQKWKTPSVSSFLIHSFSSYRWKEDGPLFQLTFCLINMEVRFKLQREGFSLLPSGWWCSGDLLRVKLQILSPWLHWFGV